METNKRVVVAQNVVCIGGSFAYMAIYHWDSGLGLFYFVFYSAFALILWIVFVLPFVEFFTGPPKLKTAAKPVPKRFLDVPEISEKDYEAQVRSPGHWWR